MRTHLLLPVLAVLLAVATAPAIAGPLDKREVQARKDFAAGRYEQAADGFAELFAQTADPIYLRNIGRCYQKLKRPQEAISSFQEYLRKARNLSAGEREEIDTYIKEMETLQAAQQPTPAPAVPQAEPAKEAPPISTVTALPPAATPPRTESAPAAGVVASAPAGSEAETARSFRIAGITTGAAGIALLGTGLAFGLAAKSASDSVSQSWDPDKDRAGQRYETLQWVGYGLGAAALGTGVFLYVYGKASSANKQQASSWNVRTALGSDGGGLAVEGQF